ncbi:acriflavin resistance protein D [Richelia intracellularis]|nr:acriflavin resistance protein D [Richelia intracellularis]
MGGLRASKFTDGKRELDVIVKLENTSVKTPQQLRQLPLYMGNGQQVQLTDVGDVIETTGPDTINHVDLERSITITTSISREAPSLRCFNRSNGNGNSGSFACFLTIWFTYRTCGFCGSIIRNSVSTRFNFCFISIYHLLAYCCPLWLLYLSLLNHGNSTHGYIGGVVKLNNCQFNSRCSGSPGYDYRFRICNFNGDSC